MSEMMNQSGLMWVMWTILLLFTVLLLAGVVAIVAWIFGVRSGEGTEHGRRPLAVAVAVAALLVLVAGAAYAAVRTNPMMNGSGMGSMMTMMDGGMMSSGQAMGSFDENKPFDLQYIDQMIMHHEGAIVSSGRMISGSEHPELRELAASIRESQSRQIEQMKEWRGEWYPDVDRTFGMMDPSMMEGMMDEGVMEQMMEGSMRETIDADTSHEMFLRLMIPHHQVAIDMSEEALERAEHPALKRLARQIIKEQSAEIKLMRGYLEEIEGSATRGVAGG